MPQGMTRGLRSCVARRARLATLLLAAILAIRMLAPEGFMPVAATDGIRIAICTGQGPAVLVMGADGKARSMPAKAPHDPATAGHCAFAVAALPLLTPRGPAPLVPVALAGMPVSLPAIPITGPPRRLRLRPPLRAPPLLV